MAEHLHCTRWRLTAFTHPLTCLMLLLLLLLLCLLLHVVHHSTHCRVQLQPIHSIASQHRLCPTHHTLHSSTSLIVLVLLVLVTLLLVLRVVLVTVTSAISLTIYNHKLLHTRSACGVATRQHNSMSVTL